MVEIYDQIGRLNSNSDPRWSDERLKQLKEESNRFRRYYLGEWPNDQN